MDLKVDIAKNHKESAYLGIKIITGRNVKTTTRRMTKEKKALGVLSDYVWIGSLAANVMA